VRWVQMVWLGNRLHGTIVTSDFNAPASGLGTGMLY